MKAPNGILSCVPAYAPGTEMVPALRQHMIASFKTWGWSPCIRTADDDDVVPVGMLHSRELGELFAEPIRRLHGGLALTALLDVPSTS